jgi:hypothetical protein
MTFDAFAQRLAVRAEMVHRAPNQPKQNEKSLAKHIYEKNCSILRGYVRKERSDIPDIVNIFEYFRGSFDGQPTR